MSYDILHFTLEYSDKLGAYYFLRKLEAALKPFGVNQLSLILKFRPDNKRMEIPPNVFFLENIDFDIFKKSIHKNTIILFHETLTSYALGEIEIPQEFYKFSKNYKTVRMIHDYSTAICPMFLNYSRYKYCQGTMSLECVKKNCISEYTYNAFLEQIMSLNSYDGIICLSESSIKRISEFGIKKEKFFKIPPLIKSQACKNEEEHVHKKKNILYASRINEQKGLYYLIVALAKLKKYDWNLIIAGEAEDREYCLKVFRLALQEGIMERIEIKGFVDQKEMIEIRRRSDFLCFPSICHETYGFSGKEAILSGIPVVAFSVEGVNEWLIDGKNGFLCKTMDANDLASHIELLLKDNNIYKTLKENCVQESLNNCYEKQVETIHQYFTKLIKSR